jgi:hypothetical protein
VGIDIVCLTVDWESAVAGYRTKGLDFYWDAAQARYQRITAAGSPWPSPPELDELPGLPGAKDEDLWCGTRAFHLVAPFYEDALRPALPDDLRRASEPVLPLLALCDEIPVPFDRQCLLTDTELTKPPTSESWPLYALRPSTVQEVLDAARSLPWPALDEFDDERGDVVGRDIPELEGYNFGMLRSFALQQLDCLHQAAQRGHGAVLFVSV